MSTINTNSIIQSVAVGAKKAVAFSKSISEKTATKQNDVKTSISTDQSNADIVSAKTHPKAHFAVNAWEAPHQTLHLDTVGTSQKQSGVSTDDKNKVENINAVPPASKTQMLAAVQKAIENSYNRVPDKVGESRHDLNKRLQVSTGRGTNENNQVFYDGSDVVVIAFEGTGAFDARRPGVMQESADILRKQGLKPDDTFYDLASEGLKTKSGKAPAWSGLGTGLLNNLVANPDLQKSTQWLSFPSEEFEGLSNADAFKKYADSPKKLLQEIKGSREGNTPGINNAVSAIRQIQAQARAQGKSPKFVLVSHSSGARSVVKLSEKTQDLKYPLALTIDPVREAHEAVGEAAVEIINKGTDHNAHRLRSGVIFLLPGDPLPEKKVYPPTVGFDRQPESLYKPRNTGKFISFYQRQDTLGLKIGGPQFGIHGSPIEGATNTEIKTKVGDSGHGEIAYHSTVVQAFIDNLQKLMPEK